MSDGFYTAVAAIMASLLGNSVVAFGLYLTYLRTVKVGTDSVTATEKNSVAITAVADANTVQHKLMNSELTELKRIITVAALAEGNLQGRAALQSEIDSKAVAVSKAVADVGSQPTTTHEKPC